MSHLTIFHAFLDHSFPQDNYIDSEPSYERLARQDVECTSYEAKLTRECIGGQLNLTDLFCENIFPTECGVTKFGEMKVS